MRGTHTPKVRRKSGGLRSRSCGEHGGLVPRFIALADDVQHEWAWMRDSSLLPLGIRQAIRPLVTIGATQVLCAPLSAGMRLRYGLSIDEHSLLGNAVLRWRHLDQLCEQIGFMEADPLNHPRLGFLDPKMRPQWLSQTGGSVRTNRVFVVDESKSHSGGPSLFVFEFRRSRLLDAGWQAAIVVSTGWVQACCGEVFADGNLAGQREAPKKDFGQSTSTAVPTPRDAINLQQLSPLELQVVTALCDGLTNTEIGMRLGRSTSTIRAATTRIYDRLGVRNRQAAVAIVAPMLGPTRAQA